MVRRKRITRRALNQRVTSGRWRITEYLYQRNGREYVNLVDVVTGQPRTLEVVANGK